MGMTESGKFEVYRKKLQGICDEHNLVYNLIKDEYPIMLKVKTTGDISGQLSMLAEAEEDGYRSPDAELVFFFKNGVLEQRTTGKFTISDALLSKLRNLYKNLHFLWLQYFHREVVENGLVGKDELPHIDEDDINEVQELDEFDGDEGDDDEDDDDYAYDDIEDSEDD